MNQVNFMAYTGQLLFTDNGFTRGTIVPSTIGKQNIYPSHRKLTLTNYKQYIQAFNSSLAKRNKLVNDYNVNSDVFIEQFNQHRQSSLHTEKFIQLVGNCSIEEYNEAAIKYNEQIGKPLVQLRRYYKITKATESIFTLIMFKYAVQIDAKNTTLERANATTERKLQKVKVNHEELANLSIDDVSCLMMSKRTIQRHVKRLADAGVLIDYQFRGQHRPVEYYVNSEILVLFDDKNGKILNTQNQLFTVVAMTSCPNNSIVTRTKINKKEIIAPVEKQAQIKEVIQLSSDNNENFYENTKQHKTEKKIMQTGGCENLPKISQNFFNVLLDKDELLNNLAGGLYNEYIVPKDLIPMLEQEAMRGYLSTMDFRELLIQYFLKMAAPIWKNHENVWKKTWSKAYSLIDENLLLNNNNSIPSKVTMLYFFENLHFRITYARRYYNRKKEYNALYPSQYFDPTRTCKRSGGFAYTVEALKQREQYRQEAQERKDKLKAAARKRDMKYKAIDLVERKIKEMLNKKITMPQLHDYVFENANIPTEVRNNLSRYIERLTLNSKTYSS